MARQSALMTVAATFLLAFAGTLRAQAPQQNPVSFNFDGGVALQSNADLDAMAVSPSIAGSSAWA